MERQLYWISQGYQDNQNFDQIELLTVHSYGEMIEQRKEERSMNGLQLVSFEEQHLHLMQDYLKVFKPILDINNKTNYLQNYVAPIVANWPGQLFIRKALALRSQSNIPQEIEFFLPILGPLYLLLNSREHVILIYHNFFEKMFHSVFGKNKKLAKKPKPWRINLLLEITRSGWVKIKSKIIEKFSLSKDIEFRTMVDLLDNLIPTTLDIYAILFRSGSFEKYIETVFRIWTFALRWKRKNYNKASLVFLSDFFYWSDNNHPFADIIKNYLSNFNDYYVENMYSRIRANISPNATAENIVKQAYIVADQDPLFKNTYSKTRHYPYSQTILDFLYKKTSLFLLNYFENIFKNQGKSISKYTGRREKKLKTYQLATLEEEVDLRYLPTAYNTSHLPKLGLCDACGFPLNNNNSAILTCSHGYHVLCYSGRCNYCENFYKIGIFENVNSFLKRLEKGAEILTQEDFDNVEIEIEEEEETEEIESEKTDVSSLLIDAINKIESW
ncbi:hypothetical protein Glove_22g49 [Diversispora epigaea]|uniref:RING-type domain-containing protein n=1 Tax=Diversispora epigaea TaxID=1348612 RepID=A0A397JR35_9GLOM|nr:hypothetical protein Glove_22g49 [Diversispora epigaea]